MTRATFTTKYASMQSEFGESYAAKLFGDYLNNVPKYSKGKNKGKYKGQLSWTKVESGGFVKDQSINGGYVETRKGWVVKAQIKDIFTNEVYLTLQRDNFTNDANIAVLVKEVA
jgi:hypothetical protein